MSKSWTIVVIAFVCLLAAGAERTIDIVEVRTHCGTPDFVKLELSVVRPSRGVFGVSGIVDIVQDIDTNQAMVEVNIFYSSNGMHYMRSPLTVPRQPMVKAMNNAYRNILMDPMLECCDIPPNENELDSPLTKRFITCEKCLFPSKSVPTGMQTGYYNAVIHVEQVPELTLALLLHVVNV